MLWMLASMAQAQDCERVSVGQLTRADGPGVLVLGARQATQKDLNRARRIVRRLAKDHAITLAIDVLPASAQDALDRFVRGVVSLEALPAALDWEHTTELSFAPYAPLIQLATDGVHVLAIGQPIALRPQDAPVQLPPGYINVLADTMGDGAVPVELESRLVQTVAYHDQQIARAALDGWDRSGWLVVLVDRTWVQGGLGVQWQAQRQTDSPVTAALLAEAGAQCYPGDRSLP